MWKVLPWALAAFGFYEADRQKRIAMSNQQALSKAVFDAQEAQKQKQLANDQQSRQPQFQAQARFTVTRLSKP